MSPGWSLIVALVVILFVVVAAMRFMRKYVEGPKPPPDRFTGQFKR